MATGGCREPASSPTWSPTAIRSARPLPGSTLPPSADREERSVRQGWQAGPGRARNHEQDHSELRHAGPEVEEGTLFLPGRRNRHGVPVHLHPRRRGAGTLRPRVENRLHSRYGRSAQGTARRRQHRQLVSNAVDPTDLEPAWARPACTTSRAGAAAARTTGCMPAGEAANGSILSGFHRQDPNTRTAVDRLPLLRDGPACPGDKGLAVTPVINVAIESFVVAGSEDTTALQHQAVEEVTEVVPAPGSCPPAAFGRGYTPPSPAGGAIFQRVLRFRS